ncbi:MAG: hypothetical protein A3J75_08615 [Acidobacteria bacterium RBG_16_68_9]|nr:MAG: hypothetical protein A3J75_08615 [Acidobacteria bacterium RBG_16_68_9]
MARIPYLDPNHASDEVRTTFAKLAAPLNVFRMMAQAQTNFRPLVRLGTSILSQQTLDAKLRELAILRVAMLSGARYEWIQHVPIARAVGATDEQIEALERGDAGAPSFNTRERLVLRFTTEVVRDVRASDAVMVEMPTCFTPQEIVELILAIGFYMLMARLMETTGVDLEPAPGTAIYDAVKPR